jgi:hypothetical protein
VKDEPPATSVDADVVVELADKGTVDDRGLAAVSLMPQVVHIAVHGGAIATRPGAVPVAQLDRAADVTGDGAAVADVERQARGVVRRAEHCLAQGGGDPGGTGDQVDRQAGDRVPQSLPRLW